MAEPAGHSFHFLFRTDRGLIGRDAWWRGVVPLVVIGTVATAIWLPLRPYAVHDLSKTPFIDLATLAAFLYLALYTFGLILLAVCFYNLSAKRFRDRDRPPALASLLPLAALLAGALIWFIPHSSGAVPEGASPVAIAAVLAVAAWTVAELGFGEGRARGP